MDAFLFPDSSLQMLATYTSYTTYTVQTALDRFSVADPLRRRLVLAWR
jgi:hypothetical protein